MAGDSGGGGHGATAAVWVTVAVIIAGSIVMGIGLIEWIWPMFWVGAGLMVIGSVGALFAGILDSVTEFHLPTAPAPEAEST